MQRTRLLQHHGRAGGASVEAYLPSPGSLLLERSSHADEREWKFFVAALEIHATRIEIDPPDSQRRWTSRVGRRASARSRNRRRADRARRSRQPLFDIPPAIGGAH